MPDERLGSAAEAIVWVDCGSAAMAELVRQVDDHSDLRTLIGGTSDDGTDPAAVAFRTPPGEPIDRLVARLGSPPPAALIEAWQGQLADLKTHLRDSRLPLHEGVLEELRVDSRGRLHVPFLPLQIAVSICRAEPQCGEQGSLAPWIYAPRRPIDLGGIDSLTAAIAGMSPGGDARPASLRARWIWAAGLAAAAVLIAIALW